MLLPLVSYLTHLLPTRFYCYGLFHLFKIVFFPTLLLNFSGTLTLYNCEKAKLKILALASASFSEAVDDLSFSASKCYYPFEFIPNLLLLLLWWWALECTLVAFLWSSSFWLWFCIPFVLPFSSFPSFFHPLAHCGHFRH